MFILKPLVHRPIALLWTGQTLSAVGSELYKVALVWTAVSLIGSAAGYLAAAQAGATLIASLIGGIWAERWDPRRTMIGANLFRAAAVALLPAAWLIAGSTPFWLLCVSALAISGLTAFFDPALQTSLPRLAATREMLPAVNGLLDGTRRLARIIGPGLVAALIALISIVHFFTINAVTFVLGALAVYALHRELPRLAAEPPPLGWRRRIVDALFAGWRSVRPNPLVRFSIISTGVSNAAWTVAFTFALVLLVKHSIADDAGAYAIVVVAYGIGNLAVNLVVSSVAIHRPARVMFIGRLVVGAGFTLMPLAPSLDWLMLAAVLAGCGGPMNEIPAVVLIQSSFPVQHIARVFRLKMALDYAATMSCLLAAPLIVDALSPSILIALCGAVYIVVGTQGLWRFGRLEAAADRAINGRGEERPAE